MKCDGCDHTYRGAKHRWVQCDGANYCEHCQRGGIHRRHSGADFSDAIDSHCQPFTSVATARPKNVQETSPYSFRVVMFPRQPPESLENRRSSHDDAVTPEPKYQSSAFLPYGIIPMAPSAALPSTNPPTMNAEPTGVCIQPSVADNRGNIGNTVTPPSSKGVAPVTPPVPKPRTHIAGRRKDSEPELDDYPDKWDPPQSDKPFRRVPLSPSDPEYSAVIQNVRRSGGDKFVGKVVQICRIENLRLYKTYRSCREDMERVNDCGTVNERILWHGTSVDALSNIYRGGFNRGYCGKNATAYGDGVYFATSFDYSAKPLYSPPDSKGQKYIFQCLVLTGHFTQGTQGLKEPPMRTEEFRYDSVVDDVLAPSMFVIFKDMQVYPEYVITVNV